MTEKDTGKHYRKRLKIKLTKEDIERGYVTVQLDPFRIAAVYGMTCNALFTVLKKILRSGSGHKDLLADLDDIDNATKRKREMMEEDQHYH